ncbi:hypothetical protein [Amycolatopsis sp.]|uniref:hypothetical protein n=1 Tax=Amycolatopsis sp. TaxID=37632 RepID=UPI002DFB680F|nr:hypothetical protein [Amycolatopsis sp.]
MPVLVIPAIETLDTTELPAVNQSGLWASIVPALLLFERAPDEQAEDALREALQSEERAPERIQLAGRRAELAATARQWAKTASITAAAIAYQTPPPDWVVWNLVRTQLSNAGETRAAATITRHRPQIQSEDEARLWAQSMAHVAWDDDTATEAVALASRYSDTPSSRRACCPI